MSYPIATLGGSNLPDQFSYKPAVPFKRTRSVQTASGVRIHSAPSIVPGDSLIPWSIQAGTRAEYNALLTLFLNESNPDFTFVGYWGDQHVVKFLQLDPPKAYAGGLFDISGSFQIISTTSWGTPG